MWIFIIVVAVATAGFLIVMASSRARKKVTFATKKKYHFEAFWAAGVAGVLVWLWVTSYPWMPPVAFSAADPAGADVQVVNITAGQWFWLMDAQGGEKLNPGKGPGFEQSPHAELVAGKTVKFVARSLDVNHGFGVFDGSDDGAPILLQMQVVPGYDNVFYYTFREPGTYSVRCLEYCGYAHPYMTSEIKVVAQQGASQIGGGG